MKTNKPSSGELLSTDKNRNTHEKLDKRRILLLLPLLVILFAALAFYATGGGKASEDTAGTPKGINTELPDAQFKKTQPADKMDIYKITESDSPETSGIESLAGKLGFSATEDPQTRQINEKLAAINREINNPVTPVKSYSSYSEKPGYTDAPLSKDVSKLEALMKNMQSSGEEDPEMSQLHSLMDKIIAVQNPDLARQNPPKAVLTVSDSLFKAIPAVIASSQKAVQGSVVELRLLDSVRINGQLIPKGHSIFGLAEFSNQRLNLQIKNIRLGNQVIPVNLTVFDKRDAMQGINAPEAIFTDAINSGSSNAIGSIGLMGIDQSLTTQIAGAGIDAAKGLLGKRIKRVKQKLKAGYPLLLRDNTKKLK